MIDESMLRIAELLFVAGSIYGGIRADIKAMHSRVDAAREAAESAHRRIDRYLEKVKP